MNYKYQEFLT